MAPTRKFVDVVGASRARARHCLRYERSSGSDGVVCEDLDACEGVVVVADESVDLERDAISHVDELDCNYSLY